MIAPRLFTVRRTRPGQLSTMAAPRGGDRLPEEMQGLRLLGVDVLVSLLAEPECRELELLDEPQAAQSAGLRFLALPTPDLETPDRSAAVALAQVLACELAAGRSVAIHCRAGIGRSSLLAATVLTLEGLAADDAWRDISEARGYPVPDTEAQRRFLDQPILDQPTSAESPGL